MADFIEKLDIEQLDKDTYSYCWQQFDLADDSLMNLDFAESCSIDDLLELFEYYGFDADKVLNYFKENPCSKLHLSTEY
jgi:hypothetical protein